MAFDLDRFISARGVRIATDTSFVLGGALVTKKGKKYTLESDLSVVTLDEDQFCAVADFFARRTILKALSFEDKLSIVASYLDVLNEEEKSAFEQELAEFKRISATKIMGANRLLQFLSAVPDESKEEVLGLIADVKFKNYPDTVDELRSLADQDGWPSELISEYLYCEDTIYITSKLSKTVAVTICSVVECLGVMGFNRLADYTELEPILQLACHESLPVALPKPKDGLPLIWFCFGEDLLLKFDSVADRHALVTWFAGGNTPMGSSFLGFWGSLAVGAKPARFVTPMTTLPAVK